METLSLILSIIALVIALMALARARRAAPAQPPARPQPAPVGASLATPDLTGTATPPPEILAIIAAAVSMVCGPNARIAGVQPAAASVGGESAAQLWALEGRRAVHAMHRPR